jgi:hypothetical protein
MLQAVEDSAQGKKRRLAARFWLKPSDGLTTVARASTTFRSQLPSLIGYPVAGHSMGLSSNGRDR